MGGTLTNRAQSRSFAWAADLPQDFRHAARRLRRNPGFAAAALLTLTLGIGGSTAIWSLLYGVLLRPLPYSEPARIVSLREGRPLSNAAGRPSLGITTNRFIEAWRQDTETLDQIAAYLPRSYTLSGDGDAVRVDAAAVSPSLFTLLRVDPALGRFFLPAEERAGAEHVVVLGDRFWRDRFGAHPGAIGRTIRLDGVPHQVVGIAPAGFHFPDAAAALWTPLVLIPPDLRPDQVSYLPGIARLRTGTTLAAAEGRGNGVLAALYRELSSASGMSLAPPNLRLVPLLEDQIADVRDGLTLLMVAVVCVLLLGCVNLANLVLARESTRTPETAVRRALGASSYRLASHSLAETALLAFAGGALGIVVAYALVKLLPLLAPADLPRLAEVRLDARALAVAVGLSLLSAAIVGLAPAWRNSRRRDVESLLSSSVRANAVTSAPPRRAVGTIAVLEIAVAATLLAGAALLIESLRTLLRVDLGVRTGGVLSSTLHLPSTLYDDRSRAGATLDAIVDHLGEAPDVVAAGLVTRLPLTEGWGYYRFPIAGRPLETDPAEWVVARPQVVSPGYLDAIGLRLEAGRWLAPGDDSESTPVVVVNSEFARRYLKNEDPLHHRVMVDGRPAAIAGVVANVLHAGGRDDPYPEIYLPHHQTSHVAEEVSVVIRTRGNPLALVPGLREIVRRVDRDLPLADVATMDDRLAATVGRSRFYAEMLGLFSGLAVCLAATGIHGVLSIETSRRRRELGIRLALGATGRQIRGLVLGHGLRLTAIGLALGLAAALALSRLLASLLFGIGPAHPPTFVMVALVLGSIALFVCYLPARRASRVDPVETLRCE